MPWNWETNQPYGAYKKLLIPKEKLKEESLLLKPVLLELKEKYQNQKLKEVEIAFEFFWNYYSLRNKKHLFNIKQNKISYQKNIFELLENIRFRNVPDSIRITFLNWSKNQWNIKLLDYSPTPYELLIFQSKGIRIVTIDWECALKGEFVFGIRDAFEHILHDLEHCYNFYREDYIHSEQTRIFGLLLQTYPEIQIFLNKNIVFRKKWEYLISDMNSYPEHLRQYAKAIFYEFLKTTQKIQETIEIGKIKKIIEIL